MPPTPPQKLRPLPLTLLLLALITLLITCTAPTKKPPALTTTQTSNNELLLADFEQPNPPITFTPLSTPDTQPTTQPSNLQRSSLRPHAGLWSLSLPSTPGTLTYTLPKPLNLSHYDLLSLQIMHTDSPLNNSAYAASISLTDASNTSSTGNPFPILSRWQPILLDLTHTPLDLTHITSIHLNILPLTPSAQQPAPPPTITLQTDTWLARSTAHTYSAVPPLPPSTTPPSHSFYITAQGTSIRVGSLNQFELEFNDTASLPGLPSTPPLSLSQGPASNPTSPIAPQGTGLFLLTQENLDTLGTLRRSDPDTAPPPAIPALPNQHLPTTPWLADAPNLWHFQVVWTSPFAALIEAHQEAGPYDSLGEPRASLLWRFMIYNSGQLFVHVEWTKASPTSPGPVSWALMLEPPASLSPPNDAQERILTDIYTAPLRQNLQTALPHRMQTDSPVALIAYPPPGGPKNNWWWAQGLYLPPTPSIQTPAQNSAQNPNPAPQFSLRKILGSGFTTPPNSPTGHADCLLLLNNPNPLQKAAAFSQYLNPPKIITRQGELDKTVPGDSDNDGFVESYGFQPIRLANGRAAFTVYPQQRPILAPTFLFTIPALERPAINFQHAHLLINIDGKQFADPPLFPDGSFLLQLPYTLDAPTTIEALLIK